MNENEDGYVDSEMADENALNDAANAEAVRRESPNSKWDCLVSQLADLVGDATFKYAEAVVIVVTDRASNKRDRRHLDELDSACMVYWLRKDVERELERRAE